jgi:hypothetical protein
MHPHPDAAGCVKIRPNNRHPDEDRDLAFEPEVHAAQPLG